MLCINYLYMWIYFLIYWNRCVTRWDSLMPSFIQPRNISWELVRLCCRFWGYHSHQKTKSLPFWSLKSLGEDGKQASAYVTSSQCWSMQRRKMEQNMKKLTALLILGNIYWSVVNSTCTDSFYTLSVLGGTHLYNYDITVLEFSRVSLVTCPVGRARQDLCPSSLASRLLFFFFLCWLLIAACRLSLVVANRGYSLGVVLT